MVRLLVFLPSLIPLFAAAVLWGWLFNRDFGLVNYVLDRLGLPTQGFFQDAGQALPMTIAVGLWGIGSAFLTYLVGLAVDPAATSTRRSPSTAAGRCGASGTSRCRCSVR